MIVASSVVVVSHCPTWPCLTLLVRTVFCKNQYFLELFALFLPSLMVTIYFVTAYTYTVLSGRTATVSGSLVCHHLPARHHQLKIVFLLKNVFPDISLINCQRNSCENSPSLFIWFNELSTDVSTVHRKYPNILQKSPQFPWVQNNIATPNKKASWPAYVCVCNSIFHNWCDLSWCDLDLKCESYLENKHQKRTFYHDFWTWFSTILQQKINLLQIP